MTKLLTFMSSTLDMVAKPGRRKLAILGPAMAVAELAGVIALFHGELQAADFHAFTMDVLRWGGGMFAVSNLLEHAISRPPQQSPEQDR